MLPRFDPATRTTNVTSPDFLRALEEWKRLNPPNTFDANWNPIYPPGNNSIPIPNSLSFLGRQGSDRTPIQNWTSVFGKPPATNPAEAFANQGTPLGPVDPTMLAHIRNWKEPIMPENLTPELAYAWRRANTSTWGQYYDQHPNEIPSQTPIQETWDFYGGQPESLSYQANNPQQSKGADFLPGWTSYQQQSANLIPESVGNSFGAGGKSPWAAEVPEWMPQQRKKQYQPLAMI